MPNKLALAPTTNEPLPPYLRRPATPTSLQLQLSPFPTRNLRNTYLAASRAQKKGKNNNKKEYTNTNKAKKRKRKNAETTPQKINKNAAHFCCGAFYAHLNTYTHTHTRTQHARTHTKAQTGAAGLPGAACLPGLFSPASPFKLWLSLAKNELHFYSA